MNEKQDLQQNLKDYHVRVSARYGDGSGWVNRQKLEEKLIENEVIVRVREDECNEVHYTLKTGEEKPEEWNRWVLSLEDTPADELVFDIRDREPEWKEGDEFILTKEFLVDNEPVRVNHVAGLEDEKRELERFLNSNDADFGLSEPTGIILEGPPGTGKTELVREICKERYGSVPVIISGPEILSKWVGESERALRNKFEEARNTQHKILYIDELDAIARSRDDASESHSAQIVAQLLVLLDGVEAKKKSEESNNDELKVIASTNLAHVVDPALRRPGRLGNRPIRFNRPDKQERVSILHHYLESIHTSEGGELGKKLQKFVTEGENNWLEFEEILEDTEGFTGAEIEDWLQESVRKIREGEGSELDLKTLSDILEKKGFTRRKGFEEEVIDVGNSDPDSRGGTPTVITESNPEFESKEQLVRQHGDPKYNEYRYRTISPKDLLDEDTVRSKENVVQAFQHRNDERLLLHIKDWELLQQARNESQLVNHLISVISEELLKWESGNILLLSGKDCPGLFESLSTSLEMG